MAPNTPSGAAQVFRVVAGLIGASIGIYAGLAMVIPIGFAFVFGFVVAKVLPSRKAFLAPAAIVGGHLLWMVLGMVLTGRWQDVVLDFAGMCAGLIWLLARPGLGPVIFLGCLQILEMAYFGYVLTTVEFASDLHKAAAVHWMLHAMALAAGIGAYMEFRKKQNLKDTPNQSLQTTPIPPA